MVRRTSSVPRSPSRRAVVGAATFAAMLVPASAPAADTFALRYEASGACPSEREFVAMVRGYTQRWSLVPEGESADLAIDVRIAPRPSTMEGTVAVTTPGGAVSRREIVGASCAEVSQALAVMVAVLLEPHGRASGETIMPSPHEPEPQDDAERPLRAETTPPPAVRPATSTNDASRGPTPVRRPRDSATLSVDVRFETTSAVVRGGLPGLGASVALRVPKIAPAWLPVLKPSIAIGVRQSPPKHRELPRGEVELSWSAAELRVCPLRFSIVRVAELSPCAAMNVGILRASASGLADARTVSTTWLDVGGAVWASIALSKTFFLSSIVLMTVPFNRQPFITDSGLRVASVPPAGVLGGIGLGANMWSF